MMNCIEMYKFSDPDMLENSNLFLQNQKSALTL